MRRVRRNLQFLVFAPVLLLAAAPTWAIVAGQVDDFQDGTTQGWQEGAVSPNPPTHVGTGGPDGIGDGYVQNVSAGGFGAGSNMIMFNLVQWTGNWNLQGIERVEMDLINQGGSPLAIRVAVEGSFTRWVSTTPFALPANGRWLHASFEINETTMTRVSGASSLSDVLANVGHFRILHNASLSFNGASIVATMGADNITAIGTPVVAAGTVPDGTDANPGTPLMITRTVEGLRLDWGASCVGTDNDFAVYEGTLGTPGSQVPVVCSTGGLTFAEFAPGAGNRFYLVVPRNDAVEGSYGVDSSDVERSASGAACVPQFVGVCE